jgi:thymidine kinase
MINIGLQEFILFQILFTLSIIFIVVFSLESIWKINNKNQPSRANFVSKKQISSPAPSSTPCKLYARLGVVSAAKTMNLLAVAHTYEMQGKKVLIMKPASDTRFGLKMVRSRTGIEREANVVFHDASDLSDEKLAEFQIKSKKVDCILVDEIQFAQEQVIDRLRELTRYCPVICFGLRTDFQQHLFPGTKRLLELAENIDEIKTTCCRCNKKSIFNLRHANGKKVTQGEQVVLGAEDCYAPVCYYHFEHWDE